MGYTSSATAQPGQTYYSGDGKTWWDLTGWISTGSVAVNAFTIPAHAPIASLSTEQLTFLYTRPKQVSTQWVEVSNTGTAPLHISRVAITGAGAASFRAQPQCAGALPAGDACTVRVDSMASSGGLPGDADLEIDSDSAAGPVQTVDLKVAPAAAAQ